MKAIRTSICSALVLCCAAAFLWTAEAEMQDKDFFAQAAEGSLAEVALGNLALQKAQSEAVKQFAQQMVTDHTQANQELTQLATTKGITVPTALSEKMQREVTELNAEPAASFDREYMELMVKDHEQDVRMFQRQAERGTDADAKAFAAKMLPTLQGHLTMARSIYDTVRGNRGGSNNGGNSSDVNRSTNVRQDTNRNPNRNGNSNGNTMTNGNTNTGGNTKAGGNTNANSNRATNANRGTNTNTRNNTNTNTNTNTGNTNGNTGNMNHR